MDLILASASPRRKELLTQIGVRFDVSPVDICEDVLSGESPEHYVQRLACEKALECFNHTDKTIPVLGSDTTVVLDTQIMGKPRDRSESLEMLLALSGRTHQVMTAVAVVTSERTDSVVVKTDVCFKELSREECESYWWTGEPLDKAGSYGIQGMGAVFVESIKGSYSSVVGLPLAETAQLLTRVNVPIWQSGKV